MWSQPASLTTSKLLQLRKTSECPSATVHRWHADMLFAGHQLFTLSVNVGWILSVSTPIVMHHMNRRFPYRMINSTECGANLQVASRASSYSWRNLPSVQSKFYFTPNNRRKSLFVYFRIFYYYLILFFSRRSVKEKIAYMSHPVTTYGDGIGNTANSYLYIDITVYSTNG